MTDHVKIISRQPEFNGYHKLETITCQPRSLLHEGYANEMSREVFHAGASVSTLLYIPETDQILLNQQFRIGAFMAGVEDPFLFECVDGRIDEDEAPEVAARREVQEETGNEALDMIALGTVYSSPGPVAQKFHLFVARIAKPQAGVFGEAHEGEEIKTHLLPAASVLEMLDQNKIKNVTTVTVLNWFFRRKSEILAKWR